MSRFITSAPKQAIFERKIAMPDFDCTEEYRDIPGFPGYKASRNGEIWSLKSSIPIKLKQQPAGKYFSLRLWDGKKAKQIGVHRAVLMAFGGPPQSPDLVCRHLDGDPSNNNSQNLAWGTHADNAADTRRHGRIGCGEIAPNAKRSLAEIERMRDMFFVDGVTQLEIAKRTGMHTSLVNAILLGRLWKDSANGRIKPRKDAPGAKITRERADKIRAQIDAGDMKLGDIAKENGVSLPIACMIGKRRIWSDGSEPAIRKRYKGRSEARRTGEMAPNCKITKSQAIDVIVMRESEGAKYSEISKWVGISPASVSRICKGQSWPGLVEYVRKEILKTDSRESPKTLVF